MIQGKPSDSASQLGVTLPPKRHLAASGDMVGHHRQGWSAAYSASTAVENIWPEMSMVLKLKKASLESIPKRLDFEWMTLVL